MKTVAYLRVSTRSQDLANQKLAILEFSQKRRFPIDQFIESRISSRQSPLERRIDEMLGTLQPGDRLLVSELSRLGRSLSQVIQIVETLVRRKIRFIAIKEAIEFDGKQQDIRALLGEDVSKASIAKILDVSRSALYHFIETRKIVPRMTRSLRTIAGAEPRPSPKVMLARPANRPLKWGNSKDWRTVSVARKWVEKGKGE